MNIIQLLCSPAGDERREVLKGTTSYAREKGITPIEFLDHFIVYLFYKFRGIDDASFIESHGYCYGEDFVYDFMEELRPADSLNERELREEFENLQVLTARLLSVLIMDSGDLGMKRRKNRRRYRAKPPKKIGRWLDEIMRQKPMNPLIRR